MKNILFCSLVFVLLVTSCDSGEPTKGWIEGMWCLTQEENYRTGELVNSSNEISWYWDLSEGYFTYYELNCDEDKSSGYKYASFSNGILTKPQNTYWNKCMEGKYTLENGRLLVADIVMYHVTKLSRDKARVDDSDWLVEGIAERVKKLE